jgi:hypothetical protein
MHAADVAAESEVEKQHASSAGSSSSSSSLYILHCLQRAASLLGMLGYSDHYKRYMTCCTTPCILLSLKTAHHLQPSTVGRLHPSTPWSTQTYATISTMLLLALLRHNLCDGSIQRYLAASRANIITQPQHPCLKHSLSAAAGAACSPCLQR